MNISHTNGIQSPHFYKPQKNKLFYIPKANILNKSNGARDCQINSEWVKETTNEHFVTEVVSPSSKLDFVKTTSPLDRLNFKILSTKNTTEETDEFNPIKNGISEILFENFARGRRQTTDTDDNPLITTDNLQLGQNGSSSTIQRDNVPSVKDIKENSSHSTIDKIYPHELMEDSMNTCSMNKDSIKRSDEKPKYEPKEKGFMQTLSTAINYFGSPSTAVSKPNQIQIKSRATTYLNAIISPTVVGRDKVLSQVVRKTSKKKTANRNILYSKSLFTADKVVKTENDEARDDHTFYLTGTGDAKDSMDDDIIEDSLNKDTDDNTILKARIKQLELEMIKLHRVIKKEKNKNKELEITLQYFQQLYKKEKSDKTEAQTAFNRVLGSL